MPGSLTIIPGGLFHGSQVFSPLAYMNAMDSRIEPEHWDIDDSRLSPYIN